MVSHVPEKAPQDGVAEKLADEWFDAIWKDAAQEVRENEAKEKAAAPTVVLKKEEEAAPAGSTVHKFRPNFVKYVMEKKGSVPAEKFLPGRWWKTLLPGLGGDCNLPLHEKMKLAVTTYSENSVYRQMNRALREDSDSGLDAYGALIRLTMLPFGLEAMRAPEAALEPFVGTVWRGCTLSKANMASYQLGSVVTWEGFSSTSTSAAQASVFRGNTEFKIHCNRCLLKCHKGKHEQLFVPAKIEHLSQYPKEDEVLYPPYTSFRVVQRIEGKTVTVVLETMEFPSLAILVENGEFEKAKEGMKVRYKAAEEKPWFCEAQEAPDSFTNKIAMMTVSVGGALQSAGLELIKLLQGMGADVTPAHQKFEDAGLGSSTLLPDNHARWYFHADAFWGDRVDHDRTFCCGGRCWQGYDAKQATLVEKWHASGCTGMVSFTVKNNIKQTVPYVVWRKGDGTFFQKAVGGGMLGRERQVWRSEDGVPNPPGQVAGGCDVM